MNKQKRKPTCSILIEHVPAKTKWVEVAGKDGIDFVQQEIAPAVCEIIDAFGEEEEKAILVPAQIKLEIKFKSSQKANVIFQLVKGFVSALATTDPTLVHYDIVRATIKKIDAKLLNDTSIIDMMARSLVEHCHKLKLRLAAPEKFQSLLNKSKEIPESFDPANGRVPLSLKIITIETTPEIESLFEKGGMFLWDYIFLNVLKGTGREGNASSKNYKYAFKRRFDLFKNQGKSPLNFWFNVEAPTIEEPFHLSPALQVLAQCIFEDTIKKRVRFKENNVAALTTNIQEPIKKLLSPQNEVVGKIEKDKNIQVFNHESLIGSITIPAIPQKIISTVFNGVHKLNTVTGHRVTRYLVLNSYDQKINGEYDFRVLKLDRGATEIAERLGLTSNKAITNIKEIIHAMAYFEFQGQRLTGNLIQLSKYKSPITRRQDAYEITIGTPLLPYQTFEDGGLLIPLLKDPPLVNPNQSHAGQYLLQMEIMEEFSKQSIRLFNDGVVLITQEQWAMLSQSCGLTPDVLSKVKDRWTQDGDDGAQFIERIDGDFYTLGKEHKKALEFLKAQGSLRVRQSNRGSASANNRLKARKKQS